ncbi:hypothetical protein QWY93_17355 [Echinicola jeungdonensis]|uniref:SWIM-type domain-containing protein n=1 Tax=Echinicola jeungdonensis TaxID=709343 RepID=A0ABV5J0G5_9BACT|nr:hypothetical protein [Echinicola jeungdonensis]MDN3671083.1 hypothetical protein [Echinicola jeungdonensis]
MVNCGFLGYRIKNCQLKHEEFVKNSHGNTTISTLVTKYAFFNRRGFCSKSFRDKNIACAHSLAWYKWKDELKNYPSWLEQEKVQSLLLNMDQTRTGIFELDHKKGELEEKKILDPSPNDQSATTEMKDNYENLIQKLQTDMDQLKQHFDKFHSV